MSERSTLVAVRFSVEEYERAKAHATELGVPLSTFVRMSTLAALTGPPRPSPPPPPFVLPPRLRADRDRAAIELAIAKANGNIGQAAIALGCARRTLQNWMRALKLPEGRPGRRRRIPNVVES